MKFTVKVLLGLVVVGAVVATSIPVAEAQCGAGSRLFAGTSGGATTSKVRFNPAGTFGAANPGSEIGRIWESTNSNNGNNWCVGGGATCDANRLPLPEGVGCPSNDSTAPWWRVVQTTNRDIQGNIATGDCVLNTCPDLDLTFLVEDFGAAPGPPGVGGTAYFTVLRTNRDAAGGCGARQWDIAKAGGAVACTSTNNTFLHQMLEHPTLKVVSSNKTSNDVNVSTNYGRPATGGSIANDVGENAFVNNGSTTADTAAIAFIDILAHAGPADPGRGRYATCGGSPCTNQGTSGNCCWTPIRQISYTGGPITNDQFTIDCGDRTEDIWVSAGITFQGGGAALNVQSALVGQAILVQCDPATADPEPKIRPGAGQRRTERPTRSGGSR